MSNDDKKQQGLTTTKQQAMANQQANPLTQLFERWSSETYMLLAPITHMAQLPQGTTLAVTEVRVDTHKDARQVYPIGGKLMLGKVVLDKISMAAGISWTSIRRMDDCRHPHLCHIEVKGSMINFDGTVRHLCDAKMTDLREDAGGGIPGEAYNEIVTKARNAKDRDGNHRPRDPAQQLMEARKFIAEIATSKAKLRAIAGGLAIHRSYSKKDLDSRPFIIPKLIPDTNDPAAKRMALAAATGGAAMLFGSQQDIELPFIEVDPIDIQESPGECAGAGEVEDDSTSASPAPNGNGDEQTGTKEVFAAVLAEYARAEAAGMTNDAFRKLCETTTGKTSREHMTASDAKALTRAVGAYVESNDPSNDGCPV